MLEVQSLQADLAQSLAGLRQRKVSPEEAESPENPPVVCIPYTASLFCRLLE